MTVQAEYDDLLAQASASPIRANLQAALDRVIAEQDDRTKLAGACLAGRAGRDARQP